MNDKGLNRDDNDLTPEQIAEKQSDLQVRRECEENRRQSIKEYSEAISKDSSSIAGQKRPSDSSHQGDSKR
jgi:hypothetical protein